MRRKIIYVDNFLTGHGNTPTTGSTLVTLFTKEGYTVIATSEQQNKVLRLVNMLYTIAVNGKNSLVIIATYSTSAFYFAWACSLTCRFFKIPYIPCLHGGNLPERIKKSRKKAAQIFANSFTNVAVSSYLQKDLIDNGWKSCLIPNNIKIEAYPFRARAKCSPDIIWVRSFHAIYNPVLAIHILRTLLTTYPSSNLTMVGPDKDGSMEKCKMLVKELEIDRHITFTGMLPPAEWITLADKCDIFINTTNFDNLPVSVVEAMALGLVVISTNVGGLPFLIDHDQNGLLLPAGDTAAFVNSITGIINDPVHSNQLSTNGRKKAEEFDWNNIKILWRNLFNSVPY